MAQRGLLKTMCLATNKSEAYLKRQLESTFSVLKDQDYKFLLNSRGNQSTMDMALPPGFFGFCTAALKKWVDRTSLLFLLLVLLNYVLLFCRASGQRGCRIIIAPRSQSLLLAIRQQLLGSSPNVHYTS